MNSKVELPDIIKQKLKMMPETGMGYQIVDFIYLNGEVKENVTVINCSIVPANDLFHVEKVIDVRMHK